MSGLLWYPPPQLHPGFSLMRIVACGIMFSAKAKLWR